MSVSTMRGQLWQPCSRRGCDNEPSCSECEGCEAKHCTCPPPPSADEIAAERATRQAKADSARVAREALLAKIDAPGFDPLSIPIERTPYAGMFETTWTTEAAPERIAMFLDRVLEREAWFAERVKRAPMTSRAELVRYLVASGKDIHYDSEHDAILRIRPQAEVAPAAATGADAVLDAFFAEQGE